MGAGVGVDVGELVGLLVGEAEAVVGATVGSLGGGVGIDVGIGEGAIVIFGSSVGGTTTVGAGVKHANVLQARSSRFGQLSARLLFSRYCHPLPHGCEQLLQSAHSV